MKKYRYKVVAAHVVSKVEELANMMAENGWRLKQTINDSRTGYHLVFEQKYET